jgi:acyl-CoA synthetase (AMP-forming)/AMP-acid ligase II
VSASPSPTSVAAGAEPWNVAAHLVARARDQPDALAVAVAVPGRDPEDPAGFVELSAAALDARCDRIAHGLRGLGLVPGMRAVLMVTPSPEFFALTFALFKLGVVPVMVDPGMGTRNLGQCLAEAEPHAFLGVPKAHVARKLFGWAPSARIHLTVGRKLLAGLAWSGPTLAAVEAAVEAAGPAEPFAVVDSGPTAMAAILFTSGSTGVPKGAVYQHRHFAAQVRRMRDVYGITPGERDLSTFPLFALFGPALGMAAIVPDMDASRPGTADPAKLIGAARRYRCTNVFVNPALLDKLGRYAERRDAGAQPPDPLLPDVRRVISAGAPARPDALARVARLLPAGVEVHTPYGATEALPVADVTSSTILGQTARITAAGGGVCVGRPVPEMTVAIVPMRDGAPLGPWRPELALAPAADGRTPIGEIAVRGPVVTEAYWARPEATALAKIPTGEGDVWHRMGDVGYLDADGRLWMCGRMGHRVADGARSWFTVPCEAIANRHPLVRRSALVPVGRDQAGKVRVEPALLLELEPATAPGQAPEVVAQVRRELAAHPITADIPHVLVYPRPFPTDVRHNAKIFREALAPWAVRALARQRVPGVVTAPSLHGRATEPAVVAPLAAALERAAAAERGAGRAGAMRGDAP